MKRYFSIQQNRAALLLLSQRVWRDQQGAALIEFAFVLPIMLLIYFGIAEVAKGVMIDRKVTSLNRALADLTSQVDSIATADMTDIFKAARLIMKPFNDAAPQMIVASIVTDGAGVAKVCWSDASNGAKALKPGDGFTLPSALRTPNTSFILARTSYTFTPTIGYVLTGPIAINSTDLFMRPRLGKPGGKNKIEQVERVGVPMCPAP